MTQEASPMLGSLAVAWQPLRLAYLTAVLAAWKRQWVPHAQRHLEDLRNAVPLSFSVMDEDGEGRHCSLYTVQSVHTEDIHAEV